MTGKESLIMVLLDLLAILLIFIGIHVFLSEGSIHIGSICVFCLAILVFGGCITYTAIKSREEEKNKEGDKE